MYHTFKKLYTKQTNLFLSFHLHDTFYYRRNVLYFTLRQINTNWWKLTGTLQLRFQRDSNAIVLLKPVLWKETSQLLNPAFIVNCTVSILLSDLASIKSPKM